MRTRLSAGLLILSLLSVPSFAAISGTVMTTDGQPVAGARVSTYPLEAMAARRARLVSATPERTPLASTQSDARGNFTIDSPKEHPVLELRVEMKGYAPAAMRVERDEEAGAVALAKAELKTGRITAAGKPVAGATVIWIGTLAEAIAKTDAEGRYSVPDPDRWAIAPVIVHPDYALVAEPVVAFARQSARSLDRTLDAGVALSGTVVAADNRTPVAKAAISIDGWPVGVSADDGTFAIAHAPRKWEQIEARSGDLHAFRARTTNPTLRLGRASTISGSVLDARTNAPVAGADVRLARNARLADSVASAITDAKGTFTIAGIAPGTYELSATRPGYTIPDASAAVTAGARVAKMLPATQQARVSGVVLDEDKAPIAAAVVSHDEVSEGDPMRFMTRMRGRGERGAYSAPDGRFTLRLDPDEDVLLQASKKGFPQVKSPSMRFTPGERKRGVTLTIPRGVALTGRVVDRDGKPLAGVAVTASEAERRAGGGMMRRVQVVLGRDANADPVRTASDGTFTMRVQPGTYDVMFRREGFAVKTLRGQEVASTAGQPVEVTLDPGVEISGRLVRAGVGVEGANVMAVTPGSQASAVTGADGSFRLEDLTPGGVMVNVSKPDEFIQVMRQFTAPARDLVIEVPAGGRVSGRVIDKATRQPITAFQAGVSSSRGGGGGMMISMQPQLRSFTSDDGTFVLDNVPVGPLQLVVNAPGYTTGRISSLTLEEGKPLTNIEVPLETGVRVMGRVTGPDGSPVSGVAVRLDANNMARGMAMLGGDAGTVTDASGEYTIDAVEAGEKTFHFSRTGFVGEQRTVELSGREARIDVQLSSGLRISGMVVTEAGVPVPEASVRATTAAGGSFGRSIRTDGGGMFQLEGLTPGRYTFTASKAGFADGTLRDVDITSGAPVRVTLKTGGIIYGHVSGLSEAELSGATVDARGAGGSATAVVDSSGNFRIDGAPTGTVRVSAETGRGFGERRTSGMKSIQLEPGGSVQVDLEFRSATVIRGRVTRNGQPVAQAMVMFNPRNAASQTSAQSTTDEAGNYSITGLDDAQYSVQVVDMQRLTPYATTYQVRGSGNFDIDIKTGSLRGRVVDSSSGEPLGDVRIQLRRSDAGENPFATRTAITDATGGFILDGVAPGSYHASADKDTYGHEVKTVQVAESRSEEVEFRLGRNDGVTLRVVDARNGSLLNAMVLVKDAQGRVIGDEGFRFGASGAVPIHLKLSPGQYRVTVMAMGYATQTASIVSPSQPTIGMTPGGIILIRSKSSTPTRGRLIDAHGEPYFRMGTRQTHFPVDPSPGVTHVPNIAPGVYTLQILDNDDRVVASMQVNVAEGQTTNVEL